MISPVEIYTDGSSLRNPGPSGTAFILRWYLEREGELPETKELTGSKGFRLSTNNRMEIMGPIEGLTEFLTQLNQRTFEEVGQINIFTDSEYVCNAVNKRWLDKWQSNNWMTSGYGGTAPHSVSNRDLWEQLLEKMGQVRSRGINVTFNHVKGHNGDPLNERADSMAVAASNDGANHLIDTVYEQSRMQR